MNDQTHKCDYRLSQFSLIFMALLLLQILGACSQLTAKKQNLDDLRWKFKSFKFYYHIAVPEIPTGAKTIEIVIPSPPSDDKQTIRNFHISSDLIDSQYIDTEHGNNILLFNSGEKIPANVAITLSFDATRKQVAPLNSLSEVKETELDLTTIPDSLQKYLRPNSLVPIDGRIKQEADSLLDNSMTTLQKAHTLYNHLFESMIYDKSGDGWGNGDALYACDVRSGNCTDIHSLFIGMARSQGIPARFRIGFPLPIELTIKKTTVAGYHCWAEFFLSGVGWIPVDISEAIKHPQEKDYYFGHLDPHRISFTLGRDILAPISAGIQEFNYLIYPKVYIDGKLYDKVESRFSVSAS